MSKTFDRYASLAFLALGAGVVYQSQTISQSAYGSNVGPNIFPMLFRKARKLYYRRQPK